MIINMKQSFYMEGGKFPKNKKQFFVTIFTDATCGSAHISRMKEYTQSLKAGPY